MTTRRFVPRLRVCCGRPAIRSRSTIRASGCWKIRRRGTRLHPARRADGGPDGLELQDRLAELGYTLPIVFLTGHGDIPTSVRAIKAGAEDFLSKPVAKETLLDAIQRALVRHQQRASMATACCPARARRHPDAAGERGLRPGGARQAQQADRLRAGYFRADDQGASPQHHAEASGPVAGRAGSDRRAPRHRGRGGRRQSE